MHHSIYRVLRLPRFLAPQAPYPCRRHFTRAERFTRPKGLTRAKHLSRRRRLLHLLREYSLEFFGR